MAKAGLSVHDSRNSVRITFSFKLQDDVICGRVSVSDAGCSHMQS